MAHQSLGCNASHAHGFYCAHLHMEEIACTFVRRITGIPLVSHMHIVFTLVQLLVRIVHLPRSSLLESRHGAVLTQQHNQEKEAPRQHLNESHILVGSRPEPIYFGKLSQRTFIVVIAIIIVIIIFA
jgi:uncharacterized membrane protein